MSCPKYSCTVFLRGQSWWAITSILAFPWLRKYKTTSVFYGFLHVLQGLLGQWSRMPYLWYPLCPLSTMSDIYMNVPPVPGFILKLQCKKPDKHISQIAEYPQVIILQTILRHRGFAAGERKFCFFSSPAAGDSASTYIRSSILNMIYNLPKDFCSIAVITFPYIHFIHWKWWHLFDLNRSEDPHRQITASAPFPTFTPIFFFFSTPLSHLRPELQVVV